jgi:glutamate carboxypeptidase
MTLPAPFADLYAYFEHNIHIYLDLLHQMVLVNSFTLNPTGVNSLGRLTADQFAPLGFTAEAIPSADPRYGQHLILTREGQPGGGSAAPVIGLISHLDTVFPLIEEQANDFTFRIEGDRIYGPGSVDIKGGTVMIYMVLDGLRHFYPDVFEGITWRILLNAAEEVLAPDFGALCRETLGSSALAALVFEGGDVEDGRFQLVTSRKGMARYHIAVEGRGAHAGAYHKKGANAIVQMADIIREVATLTDHERDLTFNVGTVMGGTMMNRVPHLATASVEMRAYDANVFEDGVARMMALNDFCSVRSLDDGYPCRVEVRLEGRWKPWPPNEATMGLFEVWRAAAAELGLAAVDMQARGGLSDGNWLWDLLPTIDGLGPQGKNAHSSERSADGSKDQEYVLASSFPPKAILNVAAIVRLVAMGGLGNPNG